MGNLLYIVAIVLVIGWLVAVFGFQLGGIIHILPVIALFVVLSRIIRGNKAV